MVPHFIEGSPEPAPPFRVPLVQELVAVRAFLAVEQEQAGARLVSEEALEKGALACLVPPGILQPLVENAVRHGIDRLAGGGLVLVAAWRDGAQLTIAVSNTIDPGMPALREGSGLARVRQQLARTYGDAGHLALRRDGDRFSVELRMPAQAGPAAVT